MVVALYLRKSRSEELSDSIAETLKKHKETLLEFAKIKRYEVKKIYEEVVSGESLYQRPQMLLLLRHVEENQYDGVLCMDIDRLGRGTMSEQGIILETFKSTNTQIITPRKTYDLNNEIDEEYTEFETFMARRELKMIKRRMQRGIEKSVKDGSYLSNAPYGYYKTMKGKQPTLAIKEEEAFFVRMMFDLYVNKGIGCQTIANTVNALGAKPHRSASFSRTSVMHILKNHVYIGKVVWNKKTHIRKNTKGNAKHLTIYHKPADWEIIDGIHPSIIEESEFLKAQKIASDRYHPPSYCGIVKNPLSGIIRCKLCASSMQRRCYKKQNVMQYLCTTKGCVKSTEFDFLEQALLNSISELLDQFKFEIIRSKAKNDQKFFQKITSSFRHQENMLLNQKEKLYELLECGVYDKETFLQRMSILTNKLEALSASSLIIETEKKDFPHPLSSEPSCKIKSVLEAYHLADAHQKNNLLKAMILSASYYKAKDWAPNQFELVIRVCKFHIPLEQSFSAQES